MKRTLKSGEKALLAVTLLGMMLLLFAGFKPRPESDRATAEIMCQSLVKAMWNGDQTTIKRLTTPQGLAALKKARADPRFGSDSKVATRIYTEWGSSAYWDERGMNHGDDWGIAHGGRFGKMDGEISVHRNDKGWQLDGYKPSSEEGLKRNRAHAGTAWNIKP